jgi:predicted transporter
VLLTVVGLTPLARAARPRWRLLLAGGVLTVAGALLRGGPGGVLLLPGLVFLASALLVPASPQSDHMRRSELERELGVFSHPAQRRLAIQAMAADDHRFPVTGRY